MPVKRAGEQHIAVFGESGSGKTVMISSFYGATQESQYLQKSLFHVVPDDIGQGNRLHKNYLGMKNSAQPPGITRFAATSYSFKIKLKDGVAARQRRPSPVEALRLVWHDYPGEWFEENVNGPEAQRKVDTFRSLLGSDVALLLVDGQRLLDNSGEEEKYLKSLLTNFRNGLLSLKDDLLDGGEPLSVFPRIWIIALSKSDLLPNLDVFKFRDLLIEKACDDIDELRKVLAGLVEDDEALSVGEDFVLFSSAKFDGDKIEVTKRVGLELILPLSVMLPFERYARWAQARQIRGKVVQNLLNGTEALAAVLIESEGDLPGPLGFLLNRFDRNQVKDAAKLASDAAKLAGDKLRDINSEARAKQDNLKATLSGFRMDLDKGEKEQTLLRSRR
ncbi:ATP/GTP-binding protein [Arthrobacter sp. ISL-5]|uniref:ATP/GTP-binding protein n=1 Tax=Arthrobacter sp. ISL-5 TaxID=2819111 RepID=UPI001BE775C4|nr:ATP/GTP-binding protein [Arthrobacter sp. ISL-5]MBT2554485.1 ATP/GTP-binding protein [Arthrobacter sp. ISL-5]